MTSMRADEECVEDCGNASVYLTGEEATRNLSTKLTIRVIWEHRATHCLRLNPTSLVMRRLWLPAVCVCFSRAPATGLQSMHDVKAWR